MRTQKILRVLCLMFVVMTYLGAKQNQKSQDKIKKAMFPGFTGGAYEALASHQIFWGTGFRYTFVQGMEKAKYEGDFGGYYELFSEVSFYKEDSSSFDDNIFFSYLIGMNLSFEKLRSGLRSFLIPYYGVKLGGAYFNRFGHGLMAVPTLGVILFANERLSITADAEFLLNSANLSAYISAGGFLTFTMNL